MRNFIWDTDTNTVYVWENDGYGWLAVFFVLSVPFIIAALWLKMVAEFIADHAAISILIYFVLSIVLSKLLYRNRKMRDRGMGVAAGVINLSTIALVQGLISIPSLIVEDPGVGTFIGWFFVTFFSIGVTVFVIKLSMLSKEGMKHFFISLGYLALTGIVIKAMFY